MSLINSKKNKIDPSKIKQVAINDQIQHLQANSPLKMDQKIEELILNHYNSNCMRIMIAKYTEEFGKIEQHIYINDQREQIEKILNQK